MIQNNTINNEIQDQFSKYILIVVEYCLINNQEILEVSDKRCDRNRQSTSQFEKFMEKLTFLNEFFLQFQN